jgi:hypothetical protein
MFFLRNKKSYKFIDYQIHTNTSRLCSTCKFNTCTKGRAMALAVSRRPLTAEVRVRFRLSPCGICCGQSGTGTGYSPSTSVIPYQFHSTCAPQTRKNEKKSNNLHHRVAI